MVILFPPWGAGNGCARSAHVLSKVLAGILALAPVLAFAGPDCSHARGCSSQLEELLAAEAKASQEAVKAAPKAAEEQGSDQIEMLPAGQAGTADLRRTGIRISYDGENLRGPGGNPLEDVDVQVKFDGLDDARQLNVSTVPERRLFLPGEAIAFYASWNYATFIERAEVRIYRAADKPQAASIATPRFVLPVGGDGYALWNDTAGLGGEAFVYSLRVYDQQGRFDETVPLALKLSDRANEIGDVTAGDRGREDDSALPGQGDDRTMVANIPIIGGKVTAYGANVPPGYDVVVDGAPVAIGDDGKFVAATILNAGEHKVTIGIIARDGSHRLDLERNIVVPASEFFYVGIADLTLGKHFGSGSAELVDAAPGEFKPIYRRGRAAFYLKGKMLGRYVLTAALDTGEDDLDRLFTHLDEKDPRQLLRRLDPDDYYPVYGDESTTVEDAPTSGHFYVRLEDGRSHVMWGNFKIRLDGAELTRVERGLYGANAELRSQAVTAYGEPVGSISALAAQPGTLPQRDEFLGTGGSAYFLKHQDITLGSEQVTVEQREETSGITVSRKVLHQNEDYTIDYIQGVVLLNRPLASSAGDDAAVKSSGLSGNRNWLVVSYEYTPLSTSVEGYAYGGRAQAWLGDHLRVGTTAFSDTTGLSDYLLFGADTMLRFSENSWLELEWARSNGTGPPSLASSDGGFAFSNATNSSSNSGGDARRATLSLDLGEAGGPSGKAGGYYEDRQAGFSAPARSARNDERLWGAFVDLGDADGAGGARLKGKYDHVDQSGGLRRDVGSGELAFPVGPRHIVALGVEQSDVAGNSGGDGNGARTDAGLKLTREIDDSHKAWVFGQTTVARESSRRRNDRVGVGASVDLSDALTASGEVSWGTSGIGLLADLAWHSTASERYHIGYRLSPDGIAGDLAGYDPFGRDYGAVVFGFDRAYGDSLSLFGEENYDFLGTQRSLTHGYGVKFTPTSEWVLSAGVEAGEVTDSLQGDFDRFAVSGGAQYRSDDVNAGLKLESRLEELVSGTGHDRDTYLAKANFAYKVSPDWRLLARADAVISQSDQSAVLNGDYVEASVGFAYRPLEIDRWNALLKYTWLYDLPGPQQVNANGFIDGPRQRSHVVSADLLYDVNQWLSLGGKYGVRFGEVDWNPPSGDFHPSTAQLGIVRADLHIVRQWDLMLEGRGLWLSELQQVQWGAVAGIYRQVGDNLKIGVGYNFGRFSDSLTDLTLDDQGVFFNIIGQF